MKRLGFRYGRNNKTAHTTIKHSLTVVIRFSYATVNVRDRYLTGRKLQSYSSRNSTHATNEPPISVPTLYLPVKRASASISGLVSSFFGFSTEFLSAG